MALKNLWTTVKNNLLIITFSQFKISTHHFRIVKTKAILCVTSGAMCGSRILVYAIGRSALSGCHGKALS